MTWLDRQSFLGSESDDVLAGATIGLVGLGGGGSHVVQQLAHAGIGSFVIVDNDTISDTNLNRLVGGTLADVHNGLSKVAIAIRTILGVNPSARIAARTGKWQSEADYLKACDIIVGGLDSVRAKDELDAFCRRFLIPYIDMGMDVNARPDGHFLISGQVALTSPGEPCLRCMQIVTDETLAFEAKNYGDAGSRPQVVWPNGLLASTAVGLVIQLLTPWGKTRFSSALIEYDGNTNTLEPSGLLAGLRRNPCPHYSVSDVGDPSFDIRILQATSATVDEPVDSLAVPTKKGIVQRLIDWLAKRKQQLHHPL